jgi:hypothetical protein
LSRSRAPERLPKKGFALFEAKPSLQSPGSIEEHRASRLRRDKWLGAFFLFLLLGKQKKKKRTANKPLLASPKISETKLYTASLYGKSG